MFQTLRAKPALWLAAALVSGGVGVLAQSAPKPTAPAPRAQAQPAPAQPAPAQKPASCENYMLLGKLYYANGQFDSAFVAFSLCLKLEPKNVEALYSLGRVEVKLQLYSAAIGHLKDCVAQDAKNVSCYVALSQAYTEQYVDSSDRKTVASQLDEALRVLDDAERVAAGNEDKAKIYNQRGTIYKYRKEVDKSLDAFKKALTLKPDDPIILFNLGSLQLSTAATKDQTQAAVDTLRRAVDVSPRDVITRAFYAKALRISGDLKGCLSESTQAFNLSGGTHSKNAFVVGQYGICLHANKNLQGARAALEQATDRKVDTGPTYHENFFFLGRVYLDMKMFKEARVVFTQAAAIDPTDETYWYWLGQANEQGGLKDEACKSYAQAMKVRQGYDEATKASSNLKCPAVPNTK